MDPLDISLTSNVFSGLITEDFLKSNVTITQYDMLDKGSDQNSIDESLEDPSTEVRGEDLRRQTILFKGYRGQVWL